jgi:general secretion pathway protein J
VGAPRRRARRWSVRMTSWRRGMTLIEVMVSSAILVMMMSAVWMSFSSTMQGADAFRKVQERDQIIRAGIGRLTAELSMSYLSFNRPLGEPRHFTLFEGRNEGRNDSVTFTAFAHTRMRLHADESDQSVIQYFVADDPDDKSRTHLYRRETPRLTGDLPEILAEYYPAYVVIEDVESFELWYWESRRLEWLEEWRTTLAEMHPDRLPERVKVRIGVRDGDKVIYYWAQTILFMQEKIDLSR